MDRSSMDSHHHPSQPLVAHGERPREGGTDRKITEVAVGVLVKPDGAFLLTSRPEGKVYAGYWEFPGGKFEAGETAVQALGRELEEEIGIRIAGAEPWRTEVVDYPHALVRLHFCKVTRWAGQLQMREGQSYRWQQLPVDVHPVLPGALPVLQWIADERHWLGGTTLEPLDPATGTRR
ncbi:MAG: CTP pyrophosphohydrolase [Paracidovorax wautersii]|uniref:8-oxo-dGTP diphosphatase n=1 Tax=Paracidovorax wautersii TaxID=1177982 RepID=A0A7V8JQX6_9BURK|nr:MAG: CTP pyrophosphohydrolase [Paracidovorax wautersii]